MGHLEQGVEQVDPEEAKELVEGGAVLLDVREDDEWSAGHPPAAIHLPMGRVMNEHAGVLPRDNRVVAVCRTGGRSQRVAVALRQAGYDVVNLAGGVRAWVEAGHDLVANDGAPGNVA